MKQFDGSDYFNKSIFIRHIVCANADVMVVNRSNKQAETEIPLDRQKTAKLNQITSFLDKYLTHLRELETLLILFRISRHKLLAFIKNELDEETYYKYNYDYYVILITTTLDICCEIGNIVYDLEMKENRTWFKFINHKKIINSSVWEISLKLTELSTKIRKERNEKVHSGVNTANRFSTIIYWNDLRKYVPVEKLKILNKDTEIKVLTATEDIENTTIKIIESVNIFFDSMTPMIKPLLDFKLQRQ